MSRLLVWALLAVVPLVEARIDVYLPALVRPCGRPAGSNPQSCQQREQQSVAPPHRSREDGLDHLAYT
jgi:hypothetical protein